MSILHLSIECLFDLLALIAGIILIIQAKDNIQKRYWGIISCCIGFIFLWENIVWLKTVLQTPSYRFTDLLNIEKMLKWYIPAIIVCLFPIASLRPGYLTPFRIMLFLLIPIILVTTAISYILFNGHITPITSFNQSFTNIGRLDVQLRCVIFILSILTPLTFTLYPLIRFDTHRKISTDMYIFWGFMCLFLAIYILFTLNISQFIFNLFGITAIVFSLFFSFRYLLYENPFSYHEKKFSFELLNQESEKLQIKKQNENELLHLFLTIDRELKKDHQFTNKDYNIKELVDKLEEKEPLILEAIKNAGFTSFKEYIYNLRLEYFKEQVESNPNLYVKELMFQCGFTSRSTFYRNFQKKYGESPSKYFTKNNE